jgi:acyl dehydratase
VSTISVGDVRELDVVDDLTRTQIVMYAGASGDYNSLHTDEWYATEVAGFPSVFAHGMLTMGMSGRLLTDWFGDESLVRYGVRFVAQVSPGDALTVRGEVVAVDTRAGLADVRIATRNQDRAEVLTGTATVRIQP